MVSILLRVMRFGTQMQDLGGLKEKFTLSEFSS